MSEFYSFIQINMCMYELEACSAVSLTEAALSRILSFNLPSVNSYFY